MSWITIKIQAELEKVKFRGCCAPVYEVDWSGKPIPVAPIEGER